MRRDLLRLYWFCLALMSLIYLAKCTSIPSGVDKATDKEIRRVLKIVERTEYYNDDIWIDGKFDCKDRALCFYLNFRGTAQIVENYAINHAFIKVYTQNGFVLIEPKTYIQDDYTMKGRWGRQFNGQALDRTEAYSYWYNARLGR
jgi:hypothetical protein